MGNDFFVFVVAENDLKEVAASSQGLAEVAGDHQGPLRPEERVSHVGCVVCDDLEVDLLRLQDQVDEHLLWHVVTGCPSGR